MPIGYIQAPKREYVGLNVDFIDRKLMQSQGRFDNARAAWSESVQTAAGQEFMDAAARDKFAEQQDALFSDVVKQHQGNLSAGFHDVMGAIEKAKMNPYHSLNKRHVEQVKTQQKLANQYGSEFIDRSSGLTEPLFTVKEGTNEIVWRDPSTIQAGGVKADDYGANLEAQVKDLAAQVIQRESGLQRTSNAYYLANQIIKEEKLTPEMLQAFLSQNGVQKAFLTNNPTAAIDTRTSPYGTTYKDMLTDPAKFTEWAYGQIADKARYNKSTSTKYMRNVGAEIAARGASDRRTAKYASDLQKKPFKSTPDFRVGKGTTAYTNKDYVQLGKDIDRTSKALDNLGYQNSTLDKAITENTGMPYASLLDRDGNIVDNKVRQAVTTKVSAMEGWDRMPPEEQQAHIKKLVDNTKTNLRARSSNNIEERNLSAAQESYEQVNNTVNEKVITPAYKEAYSELSVKNKEYLRQVLGAKELTEDVFMSNIEKINAFIDNPQALNTGYDIQYKTTAEKLRKAAGTVDKLFSGEGAVSMKETITGLYNTDPTTPTGIANTQMNASIEGMSPDEVVGMFSTMDGRPIKETNEIVQNILDTYPDVKASLFTTGKGGVYSGGNNVGIQLSYTNEDGKKISRSIIGKSDKNSPFFREVNAIRKQQIATTDWASVEQAREEYAKVNTNDGKTLYGDQIWQSLSHLENGATDQAIAFSYFDENKQMNQGEATFTTGEDALGGREYTISIPGYPEPRTFTSNSKEKAYNKFTFELGKIYNTRNPQTTKAQGTTRQQYLKETYYINKTKQ